MSKNTSFSTFWLPTTRKSKMSKNTTFLSEILTQNVEKYDISDIFWAKFCPWMSCKYDIFDILVLFKGKFQNVEWYDIFDIFYVRVRKIENVIRFPPPVLARAGEENTVYFQGVKVWQTTTYLQSVQKCIFDLNYPKMC